MKLLVSLLAFVLTISLACIYSPTPIRTPDKESKPTQNSVPVTPAVTGAPPEPSFENNAFTLCVTAEEGVWLRSKPWATSALNIPNALLAGTKVEVYLSPYGAHEWLEVWVPSEGVTGYVNTNYVGSCKDD